jgi:hypothetical protein
MKQLDIGHPQRYADDRYCPTTSRNYVARIETWRKLRASEGIDPFAPPPERLLRWLQDLSFADAANSVRSPDRNIKESMGNLLRDGAHEADGNAGTGK